MGRTLKSVTIHWKAVEQYFIVPLFVLQIYPVCNFGKCINFGLATVKSERKKKTFVPKLTYNTEGVGANFNSFIGCKSSFYRSSLNKTNFITLYRGTYRVGLTHSDINGIAFLRVKFLTRDKNRVHFGLAFIKSFPCLN